MCTRMRWDPYLTPYTNTNAKGINNLNVIAKTIQLLGNIGRNLPDYKRFGKGILDVTLKESMSNINNQEKKKYGGKT